MTFLPSLGTIEAEGAPSVSPLPKRYRLQVLEQLQAALLFRSVSVIVLLIVILISIVSVTVLPPEFYSCMGAAFLAPSVSVLGAFALPTLTE